MIELQRYHIVPEAFIAVPEAERNLFLALGSVANELMLLQKLIVSSPPGRVAEPFLQAHITHSLILHRILAGKLHEAWELLRKAYFATKLSQEYEPGLSPESKLALRSLKKYYSGANLLSKVRNDYAFHFPSGHFDLALRNRSSEPLAIYLCSFASNSLFYCSEQLLTVALIGETPTEETMETFRRFIDDAVTLAESWLNFISGYLTLFVARNRSALQDVPQIIHIDGAPRRGETSVPWFMELDPQAQEGSSGSQAENGGT